MRQREDLARESNKIGLQNVNYNPVMPSCLCSVEALSIYRQIWTKHRVAKTTPRRSHGVGCRHKPCDIELPINCCLCARRATAAAYLPYFWNSQSLLSRGQTWRALSHREMQWKWNACYVCVCVSNKVTGSKTLEVVLHCKFPMRRCIPRWSQMLGLLDTRCLRSKIEVSCIF